MNIRDEVNKCCADFLKETYLRFHSLRVNVENKDEDSQYGGGGFDTRISEELFQGSREMREMLVQLISNLDEALPQESETIDILISLQRSWHMFEIFLLNPTSLLSLEMAIWIKENHLSKLVPIEQIKETILQMPDPENYTEEKDHGVITYWDFVYSFAMIGDLCDCWELLQIHSKILSTAVSGSGRASRHVNLESQGAQLLGLILTSHPYASLTDNVDGIMTDYGQRSLQAELAVWKERVYSFHSARAGVALLQSIPELQVLLSILGGNDEVYSDIVGDGDWDRVALAQLLYVHAPPLTRADLCKILTTTMRMKPGEGDLRTRIKSIIEQKIASEVAYMWKTLGSIDIGTPILQLPALMSSVSSFYVLYLLYHSRFRDLNAINPYSADELPFYQKVIIDVCEELQVRNIVLEDNSLGLCDTKKDENVALKVLLEFIDCCPDEKIKLELTKKILPTLSIDADLKAIQISEALRDKELLTEAANVDCNRGKYWEYERTKLNCPDDCNTNCFQFYRRSQEYERMAAMVEKTLHRCMYGAANLFEGMQKPRFLVRSEANDMDPPMAATISLSIKEAKEVLQAAEVHLYVNGDMVCHSIAETNLSVLLSTLQGYKQGMEEYMKCSPSQSQEEGQEAEMQITQVRSNYMTSQHENASTDSPDIDTQMRLSADYISALVLANSTSSPAVATAPARYWLHIIELALCVGEKCQLKLLASEKIYALIIALESVLASAVCNTCTDTRSVKYHKELRLRSLQLLDKSYLMENSKAHKKGTLRLQSSSFSSSSASFCPGKEELNEEMCRDLLAGNGHFC